MRLRKKLAGYFEDNVETHGDIRQEGEDKYNYYHSRYFVIRKNGQAEIVNMNHWKGWSTLDAFFGGQYDHAPLNIGGSAGMVDVFFDLEQVSDLEELKDLKQGEEKLRGVLNLKNLDVAVVDMQGYREDIANEICSKL